jgi:hypothetical protein
VQDHPDPTWRESLARGLNQLSICGCSIDTPEARSSTGELFHRLLNEVGWAGLKDGNRI